MVNRLTKSSHCPRNRTVAGSERRSERRRGQERLGGCLPTVRSGRKPSEASDPGQHPFNNPAMPSEPLAVLDTPTGNSGRDVTTAQSPPAAGEVKRLVGVQLAGPKTGPAALLADRRNAINH